MIASFSPVELDFTAAINSTGPIGDDLDLIDPIPLPVSFPQAVHSDPAPQETVMTAAVEPAAGPFQIRDLILFDVGFVSVFDPDVGRVIRFKALTFAGSQDGPGSIQITAGQVLLVRVVYHAGPVATTETAQLLITTAEADRATIQLSLTTFVPPPLSIVETALSADHFPIVVGGRAQLSVTVRSLSGPATDVSFEKSEIFQDAKVTMQSVTVHVESGQKGTGTLLFQADPDATLGTFDLAIQQFALTPANHLPFLDIRVTVLAVPPPPGPGVDDNINWSLATRGGIQVDENVFHSGRVMDVLVTKTEEVVVAAESGGVWLVDENGDSVSVSDDWEEPDLWCLAQGPDGPRHVYAGGTALYQTIANATFPLLTWRRITLLKGIGNVQRMVTLDKLRRIVLATDTGIYWAPIPEVTADSPPTSVYDFKSAEGLVDPKASYLGLAVGPNDTVAVASWRKKVTDAPATIYFGGWIGDRLVFQESTVNLGLERLAMFATVLASSASDPFRLYAVSSASDGFTSVGLRSDDGGQTWNPLPIALDGSLDKFRDAAGNQGNDYPPNICLAVSPSNQDIVVIAWRGERLFVSTDAGQTWKVAEAAPHMHSDVRRIHFDSTDRDGQTVFTATDGGVMVTRDLGGSFQSGFNRQLPTMQFFGPRLTASERFPGLIACATQDNGNLICQAKDQPAFWQLADEGDGVLTSFIASGRLLRCNNTEEINGTEVGNRVREAAWLQNQLESGPGRVIPIDGSTDGLANSDIPLFVEGIRTPRFTNSFGELLHAIGIHGPFVYGAFGEPGALLWRLLRIIDIARDDYLTATGSRFGTVVFIGSNKGRMFVLGTATSSLQELFVENPEPDKTGSVTKIVALDEARAYAIYNASRGYVLEFGGLGWLPLGIDAEAPRGMGLPSDALTALEVDSSTFPPSLFVASYRHAYVSRDGGDIWNFAAKGLPAHAHCSDLRLATEPTGACSLYLGTYGRSVWRADL